LLDGASLNDVRAYVHGKQTEGDPVWSRPADCRPLGSRQVRRYTDRAYEVIEKTQKVSRQKLLHRALAKRQNLYRRAMLAGDFRSALAALIDEAKLRRLYPKKQTDTDVEQNNVTTNVIVSVFKRGEEVRTANAGLEPAREIHGDDHQIAGHESEAVSEDGREGNEPAADRILNE
jgi:hypothetical protein